MTAYRDRIGLSRTWEIVSIALTSALAPMGCASFATLKSARPLERGRYEFTASGSAVGAEANNHSESGNGFEPSLEIGVRYGVADGIDLGANVWYAGGEATSTFALVRSPRFDLALAPSLGMFTYGSGSYSCSPGGCPEGLESTTDVYAKIPLLAGFHLGPGGSQLVVGPELVPMAVISDVDPALLVDGKRAGLLAGGLIGVSIKVLPLLRVMPEVTILAPVSGVYTPDSGVVPAFGEFGSLFFQAALGFSWES